jgi:hydrogenase maturation protein HypF
MDAGVPAATIAARFHNTLRDIIMETSRRLWAETGLEAVALAGGVMQNHYLVSRAAPALERDGFRVLLHRRVPPGDGGICLGQLACAVARSAGG